METVNETKKGNDFVFGVLVGFGLYGAARGVYKLIANAAAKKKAEINEENETVG